MSKPDMQVVKRVIRAMREEDVLDPSWDEDHARSKVQRALESFVLIDPDDREQVARIVAEGSKAWWRGAGEEGRVDLMQAALRSLVSPPRPTEPTGLGAVIEDEQGRKWVRWPIPGDEHLAWRAELEDAFARRYDQVKVARVLSDGVA